MGIDVEIVKAKGYVIYCKDWPKDESLRQELNELEEDEGIPGTMDQNKSKKTSVRRGCSSAQVRHSIDGREEETTTRASHVPGLLWQL